MFVRLNIFFSSNNTIKNLLKESQGKRRKKDFGKSASYFSDCYYYKDTGIRIRLLPSIVYFYFLFQREYDTVI